MLGTTLGLLTALLCIALNAFFVAAEFSLVTIRHTWVEERVALGHRGAGHVKKIIARLDDAIAATQLGITIASIALGWLGEPALVRLIEPLLAPLGAWHRAAAHTIATVIAFGAITFLHVVLGELAPKAIALGHPEKSALLLARPLLYFQAAFRPIVSAMNGVGNFVVRRIGLEPPPPHARALTTFELKMLVEETHHAGSLDATQAEVLGRALDLTTRRVREVMVPRQAVAFLDLSMTEREILEKIQSTQYTRLPVWSPGRKRFIGVANTKVLLLEHARTGRLDLRAAIYQPIILHHAASLPRALRAFKRRKQHLAIVASDDGTDLGIVTLEDVLEEMVGDIDDELDQEPDSGRMSSASLARAERPSLA